MTAVPVSPTLTVEEYFRLEETSDVRHQFRDGTVFAMAGTTYHHNLIVANVVGALYRQLNGKPCRVLDSNARLRIPRKARYYYGDASVVCGPPQFDPAGPSTTTIANPRVVIEVLSDSTERFDRGSKFDDYRDVESLREYVLISQHSPRVEVYVRQQDGTWRFQPSAGLAEVAKLDSIDAELSLAEIYGGVTFDVGGGADDTPF